MIVSLDSNVLVYTIVPSPTHRRERARDLVDRGMLTGSIVLVLQTLTEFSHVAMRKAQISVRTVREHTDAWRSAFPVQGAAAEDLAAALDAVQRHHLQFWDAMLWATARRVGVRYLLTEDFQDGRLLEGVRFVNPFNPANDELVDTVLPA